MNNGNTAAYPTTPERDNLGLTKREAFTMAAMQGMLSNPTYVYDGFKALAELSIEAAEAQLSQLANTQGE